MEEIPDNIVNIYDDLFGASFSKKLYVAIEYHYTANEYGFMGMPPMEFFEKIISYSISLGGIKTALKHWWQHRLLAKEIYGHDDEGMEKERQVQIIEMEVDDFEGLVPKKPEDAYTWQNDRKPLRAIRKTTAIIERILLTEGVQQNTHAADSRIRKDAQAAMAELNKHQFYGRILSSMEYHKPLREDLIDDIDITDAPVACLACSR